MSSKQEHIFKLSIVLSFGIFGLISFLPVKTFWGYNHLAFLTDTAAYIYAAMSILILYLLYGPLPLKKQEQRFKRFDEIFWSKKYYTVLVLGIVSALAFFLFRVPSYFLGDGYTWIDVFSNSSGFVHKPTEYLSSYLLRWSQYLFGGVSKESSLLAFQLFSIVSGVIAVVNFYFISKLLTDNRQIRFLVFSTLLFSGSLLLFFGYVEFYPILWASALTFMTLALRYLRSGRGLILIIVLFLLTIMMHLQAVYLIGGLAVLILYKKFSADSFYKMPKYVFWSLGGIVAVSLSVFIYRLINFTDFQLLFLMPFEGWPRTPHYAVFSFSHLFDMFNLILLIIPGLVPLLAALTLREKITKLSEDWIFNFLLFCSLGSFLFLLVINPYIGLARDWDLMSMTLLSPVLLLLYILGKRISSMSTRLVVSYALCCLVITGSFISANVNEKSSENRYYTLLTNDKDNSSRNGWLILANKYFGEGRKDDGVLVVDEMNRRFPDYVNVEKAYSLIRRRNYPAAFAIAQPLIEKDPYNVTYLELVGNIHVGYSNFDEASICFDKALAMKPYSVSVKFAMGNMYMAMEEYEKALSLLEELILLEPDRIDIIENLASVYINLEKFDQARKLAVNLFDEDENSPSGHVIMMTLSSKTGDENKARQHYSAYSEHGQKHQDYQAVLEFFKNLSE